MRQILCPCPWQGGLNKIIFKVCQPKPFFDSLISLFCSKLLFGNILEQKLENNHQCYLGSFKQKRKQWDEVKYLAVLRKRINKNIGKGVGGQPIPPKASRFIKMIPHTRVSKPSRPFLFSTGLRMYVFFACLFSAFFNKSS